jgi:undecaprenyl-diphosphatase
MGFFQGILEWSRELVGYGPLGLFVIAFMESSFFPIPPDVLLIPLALANPSLALLYGLIATAGSVTGALLGWWIGIKGGRPVLLKLVGERKTGKIEQYFEKYGAWAIGIAGFTPIPYKIFTIASGVFRYDIKNLIFVSTISRGARFMLEAVLIMVLGNEIIVFLDGSFGMATLVLVGVGLLGYWVYLKLRWGANKTDEDVLE